MKLNKTVLFLSLFAFAGATEPFDYYEFMKKEDAIKKKEGSFFNFDLFSSEDSEDGKKKTYSEEKYGRTLKYQTYEEIKEDRKKRNTLLMLGAEYRKLDISKKLWSYNETTGQRLEVIGYDSQIEDDWTTSLYMSTLLDLKYFNIQQEKKNTYLGVNLGKYIDIDLQMDFTDGRTNDFYLMAGPNLRVNLRDQDRLISAGLQFTTGWFLTKNISIFYTAKFTSDNFISEDNDYLIKKTGVSKYIDQGIFIGTKF